MFQIFVLDNPFCRLTNKLNLLSICDTHEKQTRVRTRMLTHTRMRVRARTHTHTHTHYIKQNRHVLFTQFVFYLFFGVLYF